MSHVYTNIKPTQSQLPKLEGLVSNLWQTGITKVKTMKYVICLTMFINYPVGVFELNEKLFKFKKIMEFDTPPSHLKFSNRIVDIPDRVKNKIKDVSVNSPSIIIDSDSNIDKAFSDSIRRVSVDSGYGEVSNVTTNIITGEQTPSNDTNLTVEMMKNIEMLKSIGFIQHLKFTVIDDKVMLHEPCGYAIGDFITNRHLSYEDKFGVHHRISRIHDEHWPSVLSKKYLESIGVNTNHIIFNSN